MTRKGSGKPSSAIGAVPAACNHEIIYIACLYVAEQSRTCTAGALRQDVYVDSLQRSELMPIAQMVVCIGLKWGEALVRLAECTSHKLHPFKAPA
jgi:hypothetical protein